MSHSLFGMQPGPCLAVASEFIIYDVIKTFSASFSHHLRCIRNKKLLPPDRTKQITSYKKEFIGNKLAALLGVMWISKCKNG
jgi:hypothetical protein